MRIGLRVLLTTMREQHQIRRTNGVPNEIDTRAAHGCEYSSAGSRRIAIIRPGAVSVNPYER